MTFFTLDDIETWEEYCVVNSIPTSNTKVSPIDPDINKKISLWQGDITKLQIDAIVNAAKSSLLGGGGVDGAIHAAAGARLKNACRLLGRTNPGTAKITKGFRLPAKYVIHAVGPKDSDASVLRKTYENSLILARAHGIRSIAFPCISTGIFGFPRQKAARIAASTVREYLNRHRNTMDRVIFVVFDQTDRIIYEEKLPRYFAVYRSPIATGSTRRISQTRPASSRSSGSKSAAPEHSFSTARMRSRSPIISSRDHALTGETRRMLVRRSSSSTSSTSVGAGVPDQSQFRNVSWRITLITRRGRY